jgi:CRP/FNR family transcriptional regulator, cyclic AMP receptor protein
MARDSKVERLRAVYLFARCSDRELKKLASIADEVEFGPGQVLCTEGERAQECFVVIEGEAEVRVGDRVVATVGPGQSVGEMGLISRRPRSATVVSTTPMATYVIDGRRFASVLEASPAVSLALLEELSERLRTLDVSYASPANA